MSSKAAPRYSAQTWAKTVSWPWPDPETPMSTSTWPCSSIFTVAHSPGRTLPPASSSPAMPRPTRRRCAQIALALAPAGVVEQIERAPELERIVAAVVAHGHAVAIDQPGPVRHLGRRDHVPRPDLGRIEPELRG